MSASTDSRNRRARFDESGMALASAVLLLLVLGLLISTAVHYATHDIQRTENYYKTRAAFYIAEAGLTDALLQFNRDHTGKFPGAAGNGFNDELAGTSPDWGPFAGVPFAGGAYTVTIADNDDGDGDGSQDSDDVVILTVTGEKRGTRATIEAAVRRGGMVQEHALVTNKKLTLNGNFAISGRQGSAHSNAALDHSGDGTVKEGSTASGACTGNSCIESGADEEPVPSFNPEDFRKYANFILKGNGEIDAVAPSATGAPVFLATYEKPNGTSCWRPKGGGACVPWDDVNYLGNNSWKITGAGAPQNAVLFVEDGAGGVRGRIKVTGAPTPWVVSIISTGYIEIVANGEMHNYRNPALGKSIQDLMFMTGTDFKINGNVVIGDQNSYDPAFIAALDQVSLDGDAIIDGWIHAADQKPSPSSDADGLVEENVVSGNFKLNYEGGPESPFPGKVKILSWRELAASS